MKKTARRGLMLVLSSPSGAGKTTLAKMLLQVDSHITTSISYTTRPMRPNEVEGNDYFFVSISEFNQMIKEEAFLEYAEVFGHLYGTPRKQVEELLSNGTDVIFDIDWQGTRALTAKARMDVASIFILPPSKAELYRRLSSRNQDGADIVRFRMERSNAEISHWHEYDYIIVNRNVESSFSKITAILRAERLKKARRLSLESFVNKLLEETVEYS